MGVEEIEKAIKEVLLSYVVDFLEELSSMIISQAQRNILEFRYGDDSYAINTIGNLYNSLYSYILPTEDGYSVSIGSRMRYAKFVEKGTGPHKVPMEKLVVWAEAKGMKDDLGGLFWPVIMAIWRSIQRNGTPAKPFMEDAFRHVLNTGFTVRPSMRTQALMNRYGMKLEIGEVKFNVHRHSLS